MIYFFVQFSLLLISVTYKVSDITLKFHAVPKFGVLRQNKYLTQNFLVCFN
jgi:hypothetical protein